MERYAEKKRRMSSIDHGLFWPHPEKALKRSSQSETCNNICRGCNNQVDVSNAVRRRSNSTVLYCELCTAAGNTAVVTDVETSGAPAPKKKSKILKYRGFFFTIMSSIFFSLTAVVVKLLDNYDPVNLTLWRFQGSFLPALPLVIYHRCSKRMKREEEKARNPGEGRSNKIRLNPADSAKTFAMLLLRSFFTCNAVLLNFYSLKYMPIGDALVVLSSTPVFSYFIAFLFLREPIGVVPILTSLLALSGVGFIIRPPMLTGGGSMDENLLIGAALALGSTLSATISYVLLRYSRMVHFSTTTFFFGAWGTVQMLATALGLGVFDFPHSEKDWLLGLALIVLSFFGQISIILALRYEKAGPVTLIKTCDVVFGFVWQIVFWNLVPDILSIVGATIVVLGVVVLAIRTWVATLPEDNRTRTYLRFILK